MRLADLAAGFDIRADPALDITGLTEDSRRIEPGHLFVAVPGTALDGHAYIDDAVTRGARAVAVERHDRISAPAVIVPSAREALATMAARFYGTPARELHTIGFTGTFGKTTTSDILRQLLDAAGRKTGVLGSLGARYASFVDPGTGLTTPAPVELNRALRGLRDTGADTVIMEVTSHALRMGRVHGLLFDGGLLAAIKPGEHTDFHRTYDDYVNAKRLFLDYLSPSALLAYDADNNAARELATDARVARRAGFSIDRDRGDLNITDVRLDATGAHFTVSGSLAGAPTRLHSSLLGRAHMHNVALALTYALASGVSLEAAAPVLAQLTPLRRRMERYEANGRSVLDDTAAHPESLQATFEVASMLRDGRMVVVYAVRGARGAEINARNAIALADLANEHRARLLVVTAAHDLAGPADRVTGEERYAAERALKSRGRAYTWCDNLADAIGTALKETRPGDLIVLTGAQGMNEGRRLISSADTAA